MIKMSINMLTNFGKKLINILLFSVQHMEIQSGAAKGVHTYG